MVPTIISDDPETDPYDEKVYAAIDWFHGMKDGECRASNQRLAELIKPSNPQPRSVQNALNRLEQRGYIKREYKDEAKRNRLRIIPLIELHLVRNVDDRQEPSDVTMIDERNLDDRASETAMTRVRVLSKNRSNTSAPSAQAFNLKYLIDQMENHTRRDLQIIGLYFSQRKPDIRNKDQMSKAIKRHIRAAKELIPFEDDQIIKGFKKAADQTPGWTLETAVKMLTK